MQLLKDAEFHSLGLVLGSGYSVDAVDQGPAVGVYEPRVAAGCRLPHRLLPDGGSLYALLGTGLTIIGSARSVAPFVQAGATLDIPLTTIDLDATAVPQSSVDTILVRPDQYIAWARAVADTQGAAVVLRSALMGFESGFRSDPTDELSPAD